VKRTELQNNLAITMVLISGGMLFTTLFMGYAIYRSSAVVWPPVGASKVALGLPTLATLTILVSSWFCYLTRKAVKDANMAKAKMELNVTISLGLVFMLIQSLLWYKLKANGVYTHSGIFASILYAFTWIHAAHVVLGLTALGWLRFVMKSSDGILQKTINVERFWHFLAVIWIIMFLTLFVL